MDLDSNAQEGPNAYLVTCTCLVCQKPIDEMGTAVYSKRNKAFLHYECRDRVLAERARVEAAVSQLPAPLTLSAAHASTLGEDCKGCGHPVNLAEECWISGGRAWHGYCRPTTNE